MITGKRKMLRWAGVFLLLAAVMGALQWNWFAMPLERDEGEYAYSAWLLRTGKGVPYKDSFLQKPPMIVYTYGLVEALAPKSDKVGFRVAGFLAALVTAGLVWFLGEREFGGRAGLWGAWLWVICLQQLMFSPVAANVEKFMVVPMIGAMALVGWKEKRWWRWGLAGVAAGVAVLYKPMCVPVLALYFLLAGCMRRTRERGGMAVCFGWAATGGLLAITAGVAWFAWKGALAALWECSVDYTLAYAGRLENPFQSGWYWFREFGTWKVVAVLLVVVVGAWCKRGSGGGKWGSVFLLAWLVCMEDVVGGHYYIMALPLAALLGGAALDHVEAHMGRGCLAVAVGGLAACGLSGGEWKALSETPEELSVHLYEDVPFVEAEGAGKRVSTLCGEDETVHIVGSEPEILWYARRKSATRFDIAYPLSLPTRYAGGYQREALDSLSWKLPDVVVFARTRHGFSGPQEVYAGYLAAMGTLVQNGGYRLACAHVSRRGGWVSGGSWKELQTEGASLGIWAKEGRSDGEAPRDDSLRETRQGR